MSTEITWEDLEARLQGCMFLIGLTFVDENEAVIEQYQTSGRFKEFDDVLMRLEREDGSIYQVPYDPDTIAYAEPGEYRERSTGRIIVDPDFIIRWTINITKPEAIAEIKQHGFLA
ncbi:MAG: hypothetical protein U0176_26730 [Bacteroidia bacterium]